MIVRENLVINGKDFIKTYSDKNVYIQKVGTNEEYVEAIDLVEKDFEYIETDKEVELNVNTTGYTD